MKKHDSIQAAFDDLRELAARSPSTDARNRLRKHIGRKNNHVVGRAAALAAEWTADEFTPHLESAFNRFMKDSVRNDPGCVAKYEIAKCLLRFDQPVYDLYLTGVRHRQMESVFGGKEDTAAALRATCGRALAYTGYSEAYQELALLVMDEEVECRRITVETLAALGSTASELLLRMRVLARDPESEIMAASFQGLMQVAPQSSLRFVAAYLHDAPAVAEGAALALGESRLPEAHSILRQLYESSVEFLVKEMLLLPIALIRSDAAYEFLLNVLREDRPELAAAALRGLVLFASSPERRTEIERVVEALSSQEISAAFQTNFLDQDL